MLKGLSCRDYEGCAEAAPEAFGLSPSTVSRRFIRASARKLKELCERPLQGYDFVGLVLDGKRFEDDLMVIALGITVQGEKVVLGFVQTGTENERALTAFLRELVERGLRSEAGLLCVIDGSKGLRAAIRRVFEAHAVVQRCQWHKREGVLSHLPKGRQGRIGRKLQAAYDEPTYEGAKGALGRLRKELELLNRSAVKSLDEGLEETLTLHRLGVFPILGRSLKTTNCLESIMSLIAQRTDRVDHWRNSDQKQRWVATALLDIEPRQREFLHASNGPLDVIPPPLRSKRIVRPEKDLPGPGAAQAGLARISHQPLSGWILEGDLEDFLLLWGFRGGGRAGGWMERSREEAVCPFSSNSAHTSPWTPCPFLS